MEFPDNPLSRVLQHTFEQHEIELVLVSAISLTPMSLRIQVKDENGWDETGIKLALPLAELDDAETWISHIAWCTGAPTLQRWANGSENVVLGEQYYRWIFKPIYRRYTREFLRCWLPYSIAVDPDGGRSEPCPRFESMELLEAAAAYPACGSGNHIVTELVFIRKEE